MRSFSAWGAEGAKVGPAISWQSMATGGAGRGHSSDTGRGMTSRPPSRRMRSAGLLPPADALEIESAAKRRLGDVYDAAQERGEVRSPNTGRSASAFGSAKRC